MTADTNCADTSPNVKIEVGDHRLELIVSGENRLDRLLALIAGSEKSVDLIMYIFARDAAGLQVLDALIAAAQRGVRVRAVIDSFGSSNTPESLFTPLRAAGGRVTFFSRRWRSSYLIRNHQKLILIDGAYAMLGGFNIETDYLSDNRDDCWFDLGLIIAGPVQRQMDEWFEEIHAYCTNDDGKLLVLRRLIREWPVESGAVAWLVGGPTQRLSPWARAVRADFADARRLDMAMAYFSPGQGLLRRIGKIARNGTARLVMAAKSDNAATVGASRLLYGYLLRQKAVIWEYLPCRLHMKLIVIDDVVYIGSANFDVRSLFVNVEGMLRIADAQFAEQMRGFVAQLAPDCEVITPAMHKRRGTLLTRLRWALSWFVVGAADYTVSRKLNFGLGETEPANEA